MMAPGPDGSADGHVNFLVASSVKRSGQNPIAPSRPATHPAGMRFSINIPKFGDFADPRNVATVAAAAEQAGWDGLFVWDHVLHRQHQGRPFGDPWMLLTAAALTTSLALSTRAGSGSASGCCW